MEKKTYNPKKLQIKRGGSIEEEQKIYKIGLLGRQVITGEEKIGGPSLLVLDYRRVNKYIS